MWMRALKWHVISALDHLAGALRRHFLTESRRPAAVRSSPRAHWYVVATVCIGAFMGQLDASIVTLALPRLGRDLHAGVGAVEWVALAYLLVLVATLATVGRIADAVGRKLLYVYGFGVFTAASVLCGLAPTLPVLIAARVLQAVGAAMLQANSVALITEAVPRPLLGRAIGVQGTAQALGLALGPAIGGLLLTLGGWRLIFLVNLPAGAIGLTLGWLLLPRSRSRRPIDGADRLGALLLAIAAAGPLVYLSQATSRGYDDVALLLALGAGVLAAIGFVLPERVTAAPLIDLSILRRPAISTGLSSGLTSYLVLFGTLYVVPYYLSAKDVHPALIGLQLAVLPVTLGIAAPIAGRQLSRVGDRPLTAGGLSLAAAGMLEIAVWHGTTGLFAGLAITGLGLGAFTPANNATIMSASPAGHTGVVSGMLNMTRGIGTALGVAIAGALYTAAAGASGANAGHAGVSAAESGLTVALAVLGLLALATGLALLFSARPEADPGHGRDDGHETASPEALTPSVDHHQPTAASHARPHRQRTAHPCHLGQFGS
jgi:EmrB/QacA subfamily drug resistance transporter